MWYMLLPACCDVVGTTAGGVGLIYTTGAVGERACFRLSDDDARVCVACVRALVIYICARRGSAERLHVPYFLGI